MNKYKKNIKQFRIKNIGKGEFFDITTKELKRLKASQFKEGDIIKTGIYYIYIKYKQYNTPSLCSYHEREDFKPCGCTPGVDRPYYIDNFLNK